MCDRIIVLIDMDCFYCQVEELLDPKLKGKPIAVVQYNAWKGGGIIAVNYPARAKGVTRHMRGDEAQAKCPDIVLARVPNKQNKADLTKYRDAGKRVAEVLQTFTPLLERASVDEAYLDITENVNNWLASEQHLTKELLHDTFAVGYSSIIPFIESIYPDDESLIDENVLKLAVGACIVNSIRKAVFDETGYQCSAGIAHNKILAKLACGINKPNKQTILAHSHIQELYSTLLVNKIRSLGGKFGEYVCDSLKIKYMSELLPYTEKQLQQKFNDKYGTWLYNIARGFDYEPVVQRLTSKSIGCCKKFPGRTAITSVTSLKHWLHELAEEIIDRLKKDEIENSRKATQLVINFNLQINKKDVSNSRSTRLISYDANQIAIQSLEVINQNYPTFLDKGNVDLIALPVKFLGLNVGKFENKNDQMKGIDTFFNKVSGKERFNADCSDHNAKLKRKEKIEEPNLPDDQQRHFIPVSLDNSCQNVDKTLNLKNWNTFEVQYNQSKLELDLVCNENIDNSTDIDNEKHSNSASSTSVNKLDKSYDNYNMSSSSFFLKCYQGEIRKSPGNSEVHEKNTQCSELPQISNDIAPGNISLDSNDSYSSTAELESILHLAETSFNVEDNSSLKISPKHTFTNENNLDTDYTLALELSRCEEINDRILEKCPECSKDVPNLMIHLDHHMALKISLQQREEFRMNQKQILSPLNKIELSKTTEKKRKKMQTVSKERNKKIKTITSFFKKNHA